MRIQRFPVLILLAAVLVIGISGCEEKEKNGMEEYIDGKINAMILDPIFFPNNENPQIRFMNYYDDGAQGPATFALFSDEAEPNACLGTRTDLPNGVVAFKSHSEYISVPPGIYFVSPDNGTFCYVTPLSLEAGTKTTVSIDALGLLTTTNP